MSGSEGTNRRGASGGPMSRRVALTVLTGGGLTGLYALYALTVGPLIESPEPGPGRRTVIPDAGMPGRPAMYTQMAERYLASQPWTADRDCHTFRSGKTLLYFQDWEALEDGTAVRFHPFAMISMPENGKEDQPPITVASKSAYVRFSSKFGIDNPDPGRVIYGSLDGDVRITGPDGLDLQGRNFTFSEEAMRIFSDSQVRFAYGPHRGTAAGLDIELVPDEAAGAGSKLAVAGIKSVRLRRDVVMDLQFDQEQTSRESSGPSATGQEPQFVKVRSAGSFEFTVATNVATFADNVRVLHPTAPGKHDSLQCDLLTLIFEPEESPPGAPAAPEQDSDGPLQGLSGTLAFRRMRAEGRDVVLVSEQNELTAHMHQLVYDQQQKVAVLSAQPAVRVLQAKSEMQSPEITLVHDDKGQVTSAWCRGAGWLKHVNRETGKLELTAQWQKQLRQYPDPRTQAKVLELEGQALVRQPEEQMGLSAEFLRLWAARTESTDAATGDSAGGLRLEKLLAREKVTMATRQMLAQTARLEVWFDAMPPGSEFVPPSEIRRLSREPLQPAIHRVEAGGDSQSVRRVSAEGQPPESSRPPAPNRNSPGGDDPIEIRADLIQARVVQGKGRDDTQVKEILTTGRVHIEQRHLSGEPPLEMDGDRMHILNRSENDQLATVWGQPAHIRDRGMHIEGDRIEMDRGGNQAKVAGAGLLQLPVTRTLEGEQLAEPKLLDVVWHEQMTFDGRTAKFFGKVRAQLDESNLRCAEMHVALNRRVSFTESGGAQDGDISVEQVNCLDNVEFDSSVYEQQKLVELRRGSFAEFTLNQATGATDARGPGWIKVWRRGRGNRAALAPTATVRANKPLESDVSDWEYMRIDFSHRSKGNIKERKTAFSDRVKIIYGPVDRPLAELEFLRAELPENAGRMQCDALEIKQHPQTDAQAPYIVLRANGNTELEGRTFQARADTVTYDESKGLYILRSGGSHKAEIWRQKQVGAEGSYAASQSMWFWPAENRLKLDQATSLDGLQ